jgi:hypothetical protein
MRTITVNKTDLIDKMSANRDEHNATFRKALEVFREKAIERFEQQIADVKAGKMPDRYLNLPWPEEHTQDYDRALQMLYWHQGAEIELTEAEFTQYVQDDWGWRQSFAINTTAYVQS